MKIMMIRSTWRPSGATALATVADPARFNRACLLTSAAILSAALGLVLWPHSAMADKVYRWVDENGEVHYSESLPPDFKDQKHDLMDNRGIVHKEDLTLKPPPPKVRAKAKVEEKTELPRDASGMKRPEPLYSDAEFQRRMDAMLLLRYPSEQEIVDAMNVEINQLAYDEKLISTTLASARATYRGNIREAADRQRSGLPVEEGLANGLSDLRARIERSQHSLDLLKQRETNIREQFAAELEHYRELKAAQAAAEQADQDS